MIDDDRFDTGFKMMRELLCRGQICSTFEGEMSAPMPKTERWLKIAFLEYGPLSNVVARLRGS